MSEEKKPEKTEEKEDFFEEMTFQKEKQENKAKEKKTGEAERSLEKLDKAVQENIEEMEKMKKSSDELFKEKGIREEDLKAEKSTESAPQEQEKAMTERKELEENFEAVEEAEEEADLSREEIKKQVLEKASEESTKVKAKAPCGVPLRFLADEKEKNVFIGRAKSVYQKYGYEAALHIGRVAERERFNENVFLDGLTPHVVFVCGSRGSGKSYLLGVVAEELAKKNKNVGSIVVDPIGVFWSMRFPNKEEREVKALAEWGLQPEGLENLKVFVPKGISEKIPKTTWDATFSVQPSLLTGEDWCLTFGIDRFSPTGLLLEKALKKVEKGYATEQGKKVQGKKKNYSLADLIKCLETDAELNSKEKGFKTDSVRALVSRFDAAKSWGIFDEKGTPLSELSRENQLTVIDTSFLDDAVTALVIGLIARRLLAARKISTRKEAAQKIKSLDVEELMELDVPPTWLFIDEAHTLIPSGNVKTPATAALVEYVKQGRRPGCSLVFATQQPSAIDTRVLSQLDLIMSHKLVFDDDIKAVFKRTPTIIPEKYKKPNFIKTLPTGVALTGDRREETSRAFVMKIRPRFSQHEGRDAVTKQASYELNSEQALRLIAEMAFRKVEREKKTSINELRQLISSLNKKYQSKAKADQVMARLKEKGLGKDENSVFVPEIEKTIELPEKGLVAEPIEPSEEGFLEETELQAFPIKVLETDAKNIADRFRKKKFLGFLGGEEALEGMELKYRLLFKVQFDFYNKKNEFITRDSFIDSVTGEFVHFNKGRFLESKGLPRLGQLKSDEISVLRQLSRKPFSLRQIALAAQTDLDQAKKVLEKLVAKGLVRKTVNEKKEAFYGLKEEFDLPPSPKIDLLDSLKKLPFVQASTLSLEKVFYDKADMPKLLHFLWPNTVIRRINEVYWPIYHVGLKKDNQHRIILIDALTGQRIEN